MKIIFILCLALLLSPRLTAADDLQFGDSVSIRTDIRTVNGIRVDLSPIHRWMVSKEGERPMKHWKEVQILEIKSNVIGCDECAVKIEGGLTEVLVKNLPARTRKAFADVIDLKKQIAVIKNEVEQYEKQVQRNDAVTPIASSDPVANAQRQQVNLDAVLLKEKKEEMEKMVSRLKMIQTDPQLTSPLAMFSGQTYANLAIWDCGIENQPY